MSGMVRSAFHQIIKSSFDTCIFGIIIMRESIKFRQGNPGPDLTTFYSHQLILQKGEWGPYQYS